MTLRSPHSSTRHSSSSKSSLPLFLPRPRWLTFPTRSAPSHCHIESHAVARVLSDLPFTTTCPPQRSARGRAPAAAAPACRGRCRAGAGPAPGLRPRRGCAARPGGGDGPWPAWTPQPAGHALCQARLIRLLPTFSPSAPAATSRLPRTPSGCDRGSVCVAGVGGGLSV